MDRVIEVFSTRIVVVPFSAAFPLPADAAGLLQDAAVTPKVRQHANTEI